MTIQTGTPRINSYLYREHLPSKNSLNVEDESVRLFKQAVNYHHKYFATAGFLYGASLMGVFSTDDKLSLSIKTVYVIFSTILGLSTSMLTSRMLYYMPYYNWLNKHVEINKVSLQTRNKTISNLFHQAKGRIAYFGITGAAFGVALGSFKYYDDPKYVVVSAIGFSVFGLCVGAAAILIRSVYYKVYFSLLKVYIDVKNFTTEGLCSSHKNSIEYYNLLKTHLEMKCFNVLEKISFNSQILIEYLNWLKTHIETKSSALLERISFDRANTIKIPKENYILLDKKYSTSKVSLYVKEKNISKLLQEEIKRFAKFVIIGAVAGGIVGAIMGSNKDVSIAQMILTSALVLSIVSIVIGCITVPILRYREYGDWLKKNIEKEAFNEFERLHMNHPALRKFIDQNTLQIMLDPVRAPTSRLIYDRSTLSSLRNENGCVVDPTDNSLFHIDQVQSVPELLIELKAVYIQLLEHESQGMSSDVKAGLKALLSDLEIQVKNYLNCEITKLQALSISNEISLKKFCERVDTLTAKMNPQVNLELHIVEI